MSGKRVNEMTTAEIQALAGARGTWQVFIHSGSDTTSYVIEAADELTAAAIAGAQHGGPVGAVDIEPWDGGEGRCRSACGAPWTSAGPRLSG